MTVSDCVYWKGSDTRWHMS